MAPVERRGLRLRVTVRVGCGPFPGDRATLGNGPNTGEAIVAGADDLQEIAFDIDAEGPRLLIDLEAREPTASLQYI